MANPFLGEIRPVGFNFAPNGWALCNGAILPIQQYTALFSLLGVYYGGNGTSNFALPNLQGAVPVGMGQAPGLSPYELGQTGGSPAVALILPEIPDHNHPVSASTAAATEHSPSGFAPAEATREVYANAPTATMALPAVQLNGGSLPHNNMQPYLTITFIIALAGVYPPRS